MRFTKFEKLVILKALSLYHQNLAFYTFDNDLNTVVQSILQKLTKD